MTHTGLLHLQLGNKISRSNRVRISDVFPPRWFRPASDFALVKSTKRVFRQAAGEHEPGLN